MRIIDGFAPLALQLFDGDAQQRGGIEAEDRHGVMRFVPCTTISEEAVGGAIGELPDCRTSGECGCSGEARGEGGAVGGGVGVCEGGLSWTDAVSRYCGPVHDRRDAGTA
ncbi:MULTISPECIES: hypothetical protein [unclassified Rhizobacter]|uniref:hypothetical protein n=1 Tax=unclassified Rhizobacter TaxID=2640088 RepID=UPI0012FCCCCF